MLLKQNEDGMIARLKMFILLRQDLERVCSQTTYLTQRFHGYFAYCSSVLLSSVGKFLRIPQKCVETSDKNVIRE